MKEIIITSPSLNTKENVSGVSAVTKFIIDNNKEVNYTHFLVGKKDNENGNICIRLLKLIKSFKKWTKLLQKKKEAIIHYNYPLEKKSIVRDFFFMWYTHCKKRKIVIHIHGGLFLTQKERPWLITIILRKVFSWNCPIIVLSNGEKALLKEHFDIENITVLPNCVSLNVAKMHDKIFINKNPLHILYLGRIEKNKGIDYIISACKKLGKKNIPYMLHFAGKEQENYLKEAEKTLGQNFIYEGVVSGKEKDKLLKECDIFLLPSFYEGLPMSLLECMSFGMIPICTNVGSIGTIVKDGETGFIIPVKESQPIVNIYETIYNNREKANAISTAAKKIIIDNFSPEKYINTLNKLYNI